VLAQFALPHDDVIPNPAQFSRVRDLACSGKTCSARGSRDAVRQILRPRRAQDDSGRYLGFSQPSHYKPLQYGAER
jgi:hypothetical protein